MASELIPESGRTVIFIHALAYDVTSFLDDHPGGADLLKNVHLQDATAFFEEDPVHSDEARDILKEYRAPQFDSLWKEEAKGAGGRKSTESVGSNAEERAAAVEGSRVGTENDAADKGSDRSPTLDSVSVEKANDAASDSLLVAHPDTERIPESDHRTKVPGKDQPQVTIALDTPGSSSSTCPDPKPSSDSTLPRTQDIDQAPPESNESSRMPPRVPSFPGPNSGHSPLDWARISQNMVMPMLKLAPASSSWHRIPLSELRSHTSKETGYWLAVRGKVYDVTRYMDFHPGGRAQLLKGVGKDATRLFEEVHAWVNVDALLGKCLVGLLVAG